MGGLLLEGHRGAVAQRRVATLLVVKDLNPFEHVTACLAQVKFDLQGRKKLSCTSLSQHCPLSLML